MIFTISQLSILIILHSSASCLVSYKLYCSWKSLGPVYVRCSQNQEPGETGEEGMADYTPDESSNSSNLDQDQERNSGVEQVAPSETPPPSYDECIKNYY